ncbi:MAG: hypothetical protein JWO74_2587 [Solirubrobacterales bacterium]|nr:hypothetical protein [Solirubrobacterales bacterium]
MSTLAARPRRSARVPVAIIDPRERGQREGAIERIEHRARRVDVRLVLDDGTRAEACLAPVEAEWLDLRPGDIVWVRPLDVLPLCDGPGGSSLRTLSLSG